MSEVFGVTPWVDGAVSTGPLSAQEQDRLDVAARKGSLVAAMGNPITGGNDFSGDVSTLKLPAGVTDLTGGVSGGGGYAVAQIHTPSTSPADTAENTLFSAALPSLGVSDTIQIEALFTCTNNANTKTVRLYLGGAMFAQTSGLLGSQPNARAVFRFSNRGNAASQIATNFGMGGGALTGAVNTTVDTSTEKIVSITVQKGNSSDSVVLESAIVTRIAGS